MKRLAVVTLLAVGLLAGCSNGGSDNAKDSGSKSAESTTTVESSKKEKTVESSEKVDTDNLNYFYKDQDDIDKPDDLSVDIAIDLNTDAYKNIDVQSEQFKTQQDIFVYIDGEMLGIISEPEARTTGSTPIAGDQLTKGVHALELAQYTDDDDANGELVTYVKTTYTIE